MLDFLPGKQDYLCGSIHLRDEWSVVAVRSGREMVVETKRFLVLSPRLFNFAIGDL
jgi:hypothetical protein